MQAPALRRQVRLDSSKSSTFWKRPHCPQEGGRARAGEGHGWSGGRRRWVQGAPEGAGSAARRQLQRALAYFPASCPRSGHMKGVRQRAPAGRSAGAAAPTAWQERGSSRTHLLAEAQDAAVLEDARHHAVGGADLVPLGEGAGDEGEGK